MDKTWIENKIKECESVKPEIEKNIKSLNMPDMENIPEDRCICKWCWYCECNEETTGTAICSLDIGDSVNVNDGCCFAFEYDPDFVRY